MSISLDAIIRAARELERDTLVERYRNGETIAELARSVGHSQWWVRERLDGAGVWKSGERPAHRARAEKCGQGLHDMAEWGRETRNGRGGRECLACRRIRDAAAARRRYHEKKNQT